jgi:tRNA(fMet)-specific endonuclease VapC
VTRYLLDTNTVIALLNDSSSKPAKRVRLENPSDIAISAVVAHELFHGVFKSRRAKQNVALVDSLQFEVLAFDKEDARQAEQIRAFLLSKGMPIGPYDVLIAGQAVARNIILGTYNVAEFQRVPKLRLQD